MIHSKHWMVCFDLTKMDEVLTGYTSFLTSVVKPKTITFLHIIDSGPTTMQIIEQFPEIDSREAFEELIRNELNEQIDEHFRELSIETRVVIKEGKPINQIIDVVHTLEPDLLIMGKKVGYAGEGVIPKRILKYVPTSILFVPENCRYNLEKILVPVDFSEQSAIAVNAAAMLAGQKENSVTAQHIYEYRVQFFPYMLTQEEKDETDQKVRKKKEEFIDKFDISDQVQVQLSLHTNGKLADTVYSQMISDHSDMIILATKVKKLPALIRHDFTDKMVNYAFGIPLLILKNKEQYSKFLKSVFRD